MADISRLPVTVSEVWEWQLRAACRDMDSTVFFHSEGERGPSRARRDEQAKQVCRGCSVLWECRRYAEATREPYGVWGAQSATERRDARRGWQSDPSSFPTPPTAA